MTIEGMWGLLTASYDDPNTLDAGGIIILETGRLLGGDSAIAFLGDYHVESGSTVTGKVKTWQYNPQAGHVETVFGMAGTAGTVVEFSGTLGDGEITGKLWPSGMAQLPLNFVMRKFSDLP